MGRGQHYHRSGDHILEIHDCTTFSQKISPKIPIFVEVSPQITKYLKNR